jgi:predicted metalloprotease with PDZ domain
MLAAVAVVWASSSAAQDNQFRVDHTVEVTPATRLFHVTTEVKNIRQPQLDLALPAWTPGWYTIEHYAKNILRMKIIDGAGRTLAHRVVRQQTWRMCD